MARKKKPEGRRPSGDGSIWVDKQGQRYVLLSLSRLTEGKDRRRIKRKVVPNTQARAEEMLRELRNKFLQSANDTSEHPKTLRDAAELWLSIKRPTYARNTIAMYQKHIRKFGPLLDKPIDKLSVRDIETWLNRLMSTTAGQTVLGIFGVMRMVMDMCVRYDYLQKNPARLIDAPKIDRTESRQPWTLEEITEILDHLATNRRTDMYVIVRLGLECALRIGEVTGLMWSHIDFEEGRLRVSQQLVKDREDGALYIEKPKSSAGKRTIPLSEEMLDVLKKHKRKQEEQRQAFLAKHPQTRWNHQGFVFVTYFGGAMTPPTVSNQFTEYLKRHNLVVRTFHCLRTTAATLMSEANVPPKTVQGFLGHSDPTTTLKIYARLTDKGMQHGVEVFSSLLKKKDDKSTER